MNLIDGHNKVCKEICDALGLKHVRKLDLHISVDSLMTIEVEMYPEIDGITKFPSISKKFNLIEKKENQ